MPLPLIALAAAAAGSGILGGLTKKKARNQYASPELSNAYKDFIPRLRGDQPVYDASLSAYNKANEARIKDIAGITGQNQGDINKYMSYLSGAESDPYNILRNVTEDRLGYLRDFGDDLSEYGRGKQNLEMAKLNYSSGRGGSFVDSARQNRISTNLAPAFSSIISGSTPSASAIHSGRLANINQGLGLLDKRLETAHTGEGMELNPVLALGGVRGTELGVLGQLGQNINANIKGVREDQNWAGQAGSGLNSAINTFTSLYGMGALNKGATPAATQAATSTLPAMGNYAQYAQMAYNSPPPAQQPYWGISYGNPPPTPQSIGTFGYNSNPQSIVQSNNPTYPWYDTRNYGSLRIN